MPGQRAPSNSGCLPSTPLPGVRGVANYKSKLTIKVCAPSCIQKRAVMRLRTELCRHANLFAGAMCCAPRRPVCSVRQHSGLCGTLLSGLHTCSSSTSAHLQDVDFLNGYMDMFMPDMGAGLHTEGWKSVTVGAAAATPVAVAALQSPRNCAVFAQQQRKPVSPPRTPPPSTPPHPQLYTAQVTGGRVSSNQASISGGGVSIWGVLSPVKITGVTFSDNVAREPSLRSRCMFARRSASMCCEAVARRPPASWRPVTAVAPGRMPKRAALGACLSAAKAGSLPTPAHPLLADATPWTRNSARRWRRRLRRHVVRRDGHGRHVLKVHVCGEPPTPGAQSVAAASGLRRVPTAARSRADGLPAAHSVISGTRALAAQACAFVCRRIVQVHGRNVLLSHTLCCQCAIRFVADMLQ